MVETVAYEITGAIEELRREVASLSERLAKLERPAAPPVAAPIPPPAVKPAEPEPGITEEELLAISATVAAYLGVRPHIRQIRLISSRSWAQQGRVTIQASHRLHS